VAEIAFDDGNVVVHLGVWEQLGAFHKTLRIPFGHVSAVWTSATPRHELRGLRAPGTGLPGAVLLGTWRTRNTKDFAAIYRNRPALIVELHDDEFDRVVVSVEDPADVMERLTLELRRHHTHDR
jgi:hypothetical protein